jgi:glycosyltransferase involved in cell wall biosynthesis
MPKVLFLTIHRPDRNPSQRFRFEQYLSFLNANGFDYEFSYLLGPKDDKIFYSKGKTLLKAWLLFRTFFERIIDLYSASKYDIIFIHRECFFLGTSFFEKRFAKSDAKLIFDFDDSIWLQNVSEANRYYKFLKNPSKTMELIKLSHLVIAGNNYLVDYAKQFNRNVLVIPTTIDTNYHKPTLSFNKDKIIIGWTGTHSTIKYLINALPVLKKIQQKYPQVEFKIICENEFLIEEIQTQTTSWNKQQEIEQLQDFDIGIMPLPNDEWAKGKCGFKGLQYMGLSIPTIMSPVGVNTEIIQDGVNGFLANSDEEWIQKLSLLIESKEMREKLGNAGRQTVVEKYSVEANKQKYLEAFKSLLKN